MKTKQAYKNSSGGLSCKLFFKSFLGLVRWKIKSSFVKLRVHVNFFKLNLLPPRSLCSQGDKVRLFYLKCVMTSRVMLLSFQRFRMSIMGMMLKGTKIKHSQYWLFLTLVLCSENQIRVSSDHCCLELNAFLGLF